MQTAQPGTGEERGGQLDGPHAEDMGRRDRLLTTARHLMAQVGYERTEPADIARMAGVLETELAEHFPGGKPALLEAVFNSTWDPLNSRIADIVMAALNMRAATTSILAAMLHVMDRDNDFARLLLFEGRRLHGDNNQTPLSKGFRDFEALMVNVAERGQRDGSFTARLPAPAIASALLGAAEAMVRDRILAAMLGRLMPFSEIELRNTFETLVSGFAP